MKNEVTTYANEDIGFYPTPPALINKMLEGIDWNYVETILEPSAGKGDILRQIALKEVTTLYRGNRFDVDCIEIDPYLRQILKYNFGERNRDIHRSIDGIKSKYKYAEERFHEGWSYFNGDGYVKIPEPDQTELLSLKQELEYFFEDGIHIVHDDFLTYTPFKTYDLIIMNPPFSNGDAHLLKALDIQKGGGSIVCLLNAETIRNPYTESRKELVRLLNHYNAEITFLSDEFVIAERKTDVEVALIKVHIEFPEEESDIYEKFRKAYEADEFDPEITDIEVTDYIKAAVSRYKIECSSGIELIRQYRTLSKYMKASFENENSDCILRLTDSTDRGYDSVSINSFLKKVRLKYWRALLSNPKFIGKLTSKLQEEYRERVEKLSAYDFSEFNIYTLSTEMNARIRAGIEEEIIAMFDRLTAEHSWYPETQKNRHYYDGWATNKAHKIGSKVIIPCYGVYSSWDGRPRTYEARGALEDIERVLNFLDGGMTREISLWQTLELEFSRGNTKNVELKYFKATFYKKGTIHLVFTCPELIERFNIYAAQHKNWLPPCYGKKKYSDLDAEEKKVIDSFQGEDAYEEVLKKSDYYLAPATQHMLGLTSGNESDT